MNVQPSSKELYIPPYRRNRVINPPISSSEQQEYYNRIGGIIKAATTSQELLRLAQRPYLEESKHVYWTPGHWALWTRQLVQISQTTLNSKSTHKKIAPITLNCLLESIPLCPAGQCAQISQAAAQLDLNRTPKLAHWILNNALRNISDFSPQEIYMLIDGARRLLNFSQVRFLLQAYTDCLIQNGQKREALQAELKPQGIGCLLKVCHQLKFQGLLSDLLFEMALKDIHQFSIQEKIDLIMGLALYSDHLEAVELLNKLEEELAAVTLDMPSLIIACHHFKACRFFPEKLLPQAYTILDDQNLPMWEQINLLHALIITANPREDLQLRFQFLLEQISQPQENGCLFFTKIYPRELIRVLEMAAQMPTKNGDDLSLIPDIVQYLMNRLTSISKSDLSFLHATLLKLGCIQEAQRVQSRLKEMKNY